MSKLENIIRYKEPKNILELVNFNAEDDKWKYDPKNKDLFAYQAEGVAGIQNRFEKYSIALLADEVGMGKTIQALATMAMQFKKKPNSKVLVIVPRKEMLNQWKNEEYKVFINNHLKEKDIMPSSEFLIGLDNLHHAHGFGINKKDKGEVVFCKTTSFSHVTDDDLKKLQTQIKKFDLIVVDEAHQYRNYDDNVEEHTRRINTAKALFAKIDANILLMTATPLHSRVGDVKRVVGLFKDIGSDDDKEIMKKIMIRRLKVMKKGANKYQYRHEEKIAVALADKDSLRNELFYAILQKSLVNSENSKDLSSSKHLLDYMEGTSFKNDSENQEKTVFSKIIKKYVKVYGIPPSNQKYDEVLKVIYKSEEKALVFVRRKASAHELTRKYIEDFDKEAWEMINNALNGKNTIAMPTDREKFQTIITKHTKSASLNIKDFEKKKVVQGFLDEYRGLNKKRLGGKHTQTVLIDLAHQYFSTYEKFNEEDFKIFKDTQIAQSNDTKDKVGIPKSMILDFFKSKNNAPSTHASRFVLKFTKNTEYKEFFSKYLPKLLSYDENKAELIKSAILHSSIGVVELYAIFLKSGIRYGFFIKRVEKEKDTLRFIKEIKEFIANYDKFEKYITYNENTVEKDSDEKEDDDKKVIMTNIFNNAQPGYPYLSDTKNKYVIARFNSPFFPYLLCGTSILQEGVNLHLFCNKVYHFGAANTMGDDEQRTGRVDRVMGKMDRELDKRENAKLKIYYPYLENTFDEINLQKMLTQKRNTEIGIDTCQIPASTQKEVYLKSSISTIQELLHQSAKEVSTEPYPWN